MLAALEAVQQESVSTLPCLPFKPKLAIDTCKPSHHSSRLTLLSGALKHQCCTTWSPAVACCMGHHSGLHCKPIHIHSAACWACAISLGTMWAH
jgi:hypothetical protein